MTLSVREGPVVHTDNDGVVVVYKEDSLKLRVPVYDGVRTITAPYGALRDVSSANITGTLTIDKPDDSADLTRTTSSGGAKADNDSDGTNDSFDFYILGSVTSGWVAGYHQWTVLYTDTGGTGGQDDVTVATGRILVRVRPEDEA